MVEQVGAMLKILALPLMASQPMQTLEDGKTASKLTCHSLEASKLHLLQFKQLLLTPQQDSTTPLLQKFPHHFQEYQLLIKLKLLSPTLQVLLILLRETLKWCSFCKTHHLKIPTTTVGALRSLLSNGLLHLQLILLFVDLQTRMEESAGAMFKIAALLLMVNLLTPTLVVGKTASKKALHLLVP